MAPKLQLLLKNQQNIIDDIQLLHYNFKKDSNYRKTQQYLERRLERLEKYFKLFMKNHEAIKLFGDLNIKYYEEGQYTKLVDCYNTIKSTFENHKPYTGPDPAKTQEIVAPKVETSRRKLLRERSNVTTQKKESGATGIKTARNAKSNLVPKSQFRWRPKIQLSPNNRNRTFNRPPMKQKEIIKSKTSIQNRPSPSRNKKLVEDVPLERNQSFCAILGCHNQKNTKPPVFIHPFPQDEEKRELWVQMTGRKNFKPQPSSFVCGKHFDSSDYSKDKHTLNATAVPSLHLHLPDGVMQIEYIEDIDEEGFQILMNGNAKTSNEKKRKNSEEINHNWKIPKPNEQESRVAMEKFRELYTTQEMVAMKIMRYKQDLKKYARVCSEADELKAVLKKRRQSQQDDKSKLLKILDGISKKEPIDENLDSTSQKDASAEQIVTSDEELIEMLPTRYTEEVKKFASNLYTFNPDAYVYLRHTLRTLLPDVDYLRSLAKTGFKAPPAEKVTAIKVTTEMSEDCMNLKIQTD